MGFIFVYPFSAMFTRTSMSWKMNSCNDIYWQIRGISALIWILCFKLHSRKFNTCSRTWNKLTWQTVSDIYYPQRRKWCNFEISDAKRTYNIGFRMNRTQCSTRCKPVNPRAEKRASFIIVSLIPLMHISCRMMTI